MDSGRYLFPSLRGGRGCVILILRIRRGSLACDLHTPCPPLERGRDTLQPDLDRCTTLADEIDAGRKGDRRLAAQER